MSADRTAALRGLPSVDVVVRAVAARAEMVDVPRVRLTATVRDVLDRERRRVLTTGGPALDAEALAAQVVNATSRAGLFSLRTVINATGVVLHTNLGRALLSPLAVERLVAAASTYTNLELDLATKERVETDLAAGG